MADRSEETTSNHGIRSTFDKALSGVYRYETTKEDSMEDTTVDSLPTLKVFDHLYKGKVGAHSSRACEATYHALISSTVLTNVKIEDMKSAKE